MPNYGNAKVYKIVCNISGDVYIGSTTVSLSRRLVQHRSDYKMHTEGSKRSKCRSFEVLKNGDYNIVLIENFKCESKEQLLSRERYYIDSIECVNKVLPTQTPQEWRDKNRDEKKKYDKDFRDKNIGKIKMYDQIKINCPCGLTCSKHKFSRHIKSKTHQTYILNLDATTTD